MRPGVTLGNSFHGNEFKVAVVDARTCDRADNVIELAVLHGKRRRGAFYILRASAHREAGWGVPFLMFLMHSRSLCMSRNRRFMIPMMLMAVASLYFDSTWFLKRATSSKEISEREEKYFRHVGEVACVDIERRRRKALAFQRVKIVLGSFFQVLRV